MDYFTLRSVMDKMENSDSDYRYMATSDLLSQLRNDKIKLKADHDTQKRLSRAVLKLLKDSNSEVQGMATKCLPPLTAFVHLDNATHIVERLLDYILLHDPTKGRQSSPDVIGQKAVRDVASLALKTILHDLSPTSLKAPAISKSIVPRLVATISASAPDPNHTDTLIDTLELLYELVSRLGHLLTEYHHTICEALFVHFSCKSPLVRKRAIACIASLAAVCNNAIFVTIVNQSLGYLQNPSGHDAVRTGVQAISALSRTSGHRLATHLPVLAPILFDYFSPNAHADDDDLREHCLQALESFCLRCRREMLPFAERLTNAVVTLAKYDPNYVMDDDDGNDLDQSDDGSNAAGMAEDDDDGLDDYDDDDYSDDDDSSWKVRRAAIRCIHAAISAQLLPLAQLCSSFGPFLVSRFKEREEAVKLDVFAAFDELLRFCGNRSLEPLTMGTSSSQLAIFDDSMAIDDDASTNSDIETIINCGPQLIRGLKKELSSRSSKTKVRAMALAGSVVTSLPALVTALVAKVMDQIKQGLADSATGMRTETLLFLRIIVKVGGATPLVQHVDGLMPRVLATTDDRYYKVTAECLRFCASVVLAFGQSPPECRAKLSPLVPAIYDAALCRATAQDQDSEVKEAALHCLGGTVARFSSDLPADQLGEVPRVLRDRLGNEVTRVSTVRALRLIATSESAHVLTPALDDIAAMVSSFLRKSDSKLRTVSVELLTVIPVLSANNDATLVANISGLINDTDLRVASMALQLATKIVKERGAAVVPLLTQTGSIYPKALNLSMSPLLQGRTIDSLLELFSSLAHVNSEPVTIQQILQALEKQAEAVSFSITTSSARGSPLYCIAKCIVAVCRAAETNLRIQTTQRIIGNINLNDFKIRIFALACLGEFGRGSLLPREGNEKSVVRNAVLNALEAPVEEVKTAAAVALGGLASADGAADVPALVVLIRERTDQRYLLLLSLKEAISSASRSALKCLAGLVLPLLLDQPPGFDVSDGNVGRRRSSEEESIRTATAECLGLLAEGCPDMVLETLKQASASPSADVRAAVASAVKFAVSWSAAVGSSPSMHLRSALHIFIQMIGDNDVMVAKNAVQAVNAMGKSRPALLHPHLSRALPLIYARTTKDKELVRVVDLGPFKHEEDYGLDLRKSAFDCLRTLISGPLCESIHLVGFLENVVVGLQDQSDVRSIAQLILITAAGTEKAAQMVNVMDTIVSALENTLSERLKDSAVRQEVERHEDSVRGALRAVHAMGKVPEVAANHSFQSLVNGVMRSQRLAERYDAVCKSEVNLLSLSSGGGHDGLANMADDSMQD